MVWLLGLVPAAIVTMVRGRWLLFAVGFLTLGLVWFVGALARDPDGPPEFRNAWPLVAALAAAVLVLGVFGARPTPVLGIDGEALQSSVGGIDVLSFEPESCEGGDGEWTCFVYESEISGSVSYRVEVDWKGCWEAVKVGQSRGENPRTLSGCASLVDYVF